MCSNLSVELFQLIHFLVGFYNIHCATLQLHSNSSQMWKVLICCEKSTMNWNSVTQWGQGGGSALWIHVSRGIFEVVTQFLRMHLQKQSLQGQWQWTCSIDKSAERWDAFQPSMSCMDLSMVSFYSAKSHFHSPLPRGAHYAWGSWWKIGMLLSSGQVHSSPLVKNTKGWSQGWGCVHYSVCMLLVIISA